MPPPPNAHIHIHSDKCYFASMPVMLFFPLKIVVFNIKFSKSFRKGLIRLYHLHIACNHILKKALGVIAVEEPMECKEPNVKL